MNKKLNQNAFFMRTLFKIFDILFLPFSYVNNAVKLTENIVHVSMYALTRRVNKIKGKT